MTVQQTQTTYTIGQELQRRVLWEVDFDTPTSGVHQVQATLHYWPDSDPIEGEDIYDFQWETVRDADKGVNCIYEALEDGTRGRDYDGRTRIFASRDEAVAACIAALEKRIASAQRAITKLSDKEA